MREDGFQIDKLVITTDPGYVPTNQGPPESPQGTATLAAPTISPNSGSFTFSLTTSIFAYPSEATIYYTLDGSEPNTGSLIYSGALTLTEDTTVKAMASLSGYNDSAVSTATYNQTSCTPTRIMPLGDSITLGVYGPVIAGPEAGYIVGYRQRLYERLTANNYFIDFVGGESEGNLVLPAFDTDHEGHSGWSDTEIADNIYNWLNANPADIVLLHAGTNDLDASPADIERILDEIDRHNFNTVVVLAKIINRVPYSDVTAQFNANIEQMALNRIAIGDNIIIVDQENALIYPDDIYDDKHPNQTGYEKMADTWFDAITSFMAPQTCNL
jgi:lysophospholipase L1-like esterase